MKDESMKVLKETKPIGIPFFSEVLALFRMDLFGAAH